MNTTVFAATTPENTPSVYRASTSANPNPMISHAFVEANYEDYDGEREMEPRPEPNKEATPTLRLREGRREGRNTEGSRPSETKTRENGNKGVNLPPLLAVHLGRNESGQPLQSSLTSVHGGHQPSTNIGGNLPLNGTLLSHHAQPFIPSSLYTPTGLMPIHVNPYSQPSMGIVNGQPLNFPFQTQIGNPLTGGISAYHSQGGIYHRLSRTMEYPHIMGLRSFVDSTGSVTPFVRWIEDYPLPNGLKMPYHIGSYDGKGDPDNFLHVFEGAISHAKMVNARQKGKDRFSLYRGPNHGLLSSLSKSPKEILATEKAARSFKQPTRMFGSRRSRDMSKYCHFYEDHGHGTNESHQLRNQIEEAVKSGQLSHLVKGIKKERVKAPENQRVEGKKDKGTAPAKAPIIMIRQDESYTKNNALEGFSLESREITFPSKGSNSSAPDSNAEDGNRGKRRNEEGQRDAPIKQKRGLQLCCGRRKGIPRTIMVEGKPFNTEHKLSKYSHVKPIKQKRRGLGPDRSTAACKEVEELTKVGILRKVKHQTWVANPVMVKKSDGGWRMCVDFTDINKACPKECYLYLKLARR
ncbi:hypothetical protein Tco_0340530 [Tanacetum coccineum]